MEDILLLDSVINCLSISSNDFCCGWAAELFAGCGVDARSPDCPGFLCAPPLKLQNVTFYLPNGFIHHSVFIVKDSQSYYLFA